MINEQDFTNVNQIDMDCQFVDDDDSFGISSNNTGADDREVQSKTGIIIDFDDDDDVPVHQIKADTRVDNNFINFESDFSEEEFHDYNSIDMDTKYSEDDDEISVETNKKQKSNPIFFDTDDEEKELICSELIDEGKKKKTFGEVEDDYWKTLTKKHASSNKKGAYNTSFHFAGNPEKERQIFNHMMGTDTEVVSSAIGSDSLMSSSATSSSVASVAASGGEGCCESIETDNYGKQLLELFDIIGFEVFKNSDDSYIAIDKCDILPSITVKSLPDLVETLKPYIDDCLIYPLQVATNQKINTYKEWADWYNSDMHKAFPKCESDIKYCDLLANHLDECVVD